MRVPANAQPGLALAAGLLLLACGPAAAPTSNTVSPPPPPTGPTAPVITTDTPPTDTPTPTTSDWVDAGGGLSLRLEVPAALGDTITTRLHFRNDGAQPLRVYMIGGEVFRAHQSDFQLLAADGRVLARQPEPHPHGYVVTEADFPEIGPGATRTFEQSLRLDPAAPVQPVRLRWSYHNTIERWQGGRQTLDGPSKNLFGGGPIPGIWRGDATLELPLPRRS